MILQIPTDARQGNLRLDPMAGKLVFWSDPRPHQQFGRLVGAGCKNDLSTCKRLLLRSVLQIADANRLAVFHPDARHDGLRFDGQQRIAGRDRALP